MPCSRAASAMNSCISPLPKCSACATLSESRMPMIGQYSGSSTSCAPCCAACPISAPPAARLCLTSSVDTVCTAATLKIWFGMVSTHRGKNAWLRIRRDRWGIADAALKFFDGRIFPRPRDLVLHRKRLHQRISLKQLCQKRAQSDDRIHHQAVDHGSCADIDFRDFHHMQVLRFLGDVGAAVYQDHGADTAHLQIVGIDYALRNRCSTDHAVEGKTFGKDVAKIERQAARQRLQA